VSIIGLVPLASVYEIDEEKKGRALAINQALFNSLASKMNGQQHLMYRRQGDKVVTQELHGLFDFISVEIGILFITLLA